MSNTHLIELSDPGLRVSSLSDTLVQSPGFVNVAGSAPLFGEAARQQSRLHPRLTFNQFWAQLSMDPLVQENAFFRHQADAAYGHLKTLADENELHDQAVFAIPGHFTRQQLAILLGLARQLPFTPVGLVDMGLLAAADVQIADRALYLDMQLHQCVLTLIRREQNELVRDRTQQVPGTGLLALQDAWAGMISDAFVRQSRFNPQHNAETEQHLYNSLQSWINEAMSGNEVLMNINFRGTNYQAGTSRSQFEQKAASLLARLRQEIEALGGDDCQLIVSSHLAGLPGIGKALPAFDRVAEGQLADNAFRFLERIRREEDQLGLITRLPAPAVQHGTARGAPEKGATQRQLALLSGHQAHRLPASGPFRIGPRQADLNMDSEASLLLAAENGQLSVSEHDTGIRLNDTGLTPGAILRPGDRLTLPGMDSPLLLIEVR